MFHGQMIEFPPFPLLRSLSSLSLVLSHNKKILKHMYIVGQESNNDPPYHNAELEKLIAQQGVSSELKLGSKELTDQEIKIVTNALKTKKVRE